MQAFTEPLPALFVDTHNSLSGNGGGVQLFTRDALTTLAAAGFSVTTLPFDLDRRFRTRVMQRLRPTVRPRTAPPELTQIIERAVEVHESRYVFFGATRFVAVSRYLRRRFPELLQVLISQGVEAIDFCLDQQFRHRTGGQTRSRARANRMLGDDLLEEAEHRQYVDAVLCLSPFEEELERWLGAPAVRWIPRPIVEPPLDLQPMEGRVGCVSTLDHSPNRDGLVRLFDQLASVAQPPFRFRLVGQPEAEGRQLAARYSFVDYVGPLDEAALRREASTWCCFVHPLFANAKGCSTKLAVGLGWRLPVATTRLGARGYCWDEDALPLFDTPAQLTAAVVDRSRTDHLPEFQRQTLAIVRLTPSLATIGDELRQFLCGLSGKPTLAARVNRANPWARPRTRFGSGIAG